MHTGLVFVHHQVGVDVEDEHGLHLEVGVLQQLLGLDLAAKPLVVGVVLVHHQVGVDVEDGHGLH